MPHITRIIRLMLTICLQVSSADNIGWTHIRPDAFSGLDLQPNVLILQYFQDLFLKKADFVKLSRRPKSIKIILYAKS